MDKLIELLNEYEKYISLGGLADWRKFDGNLHYYSNSKDEYVFDNVYYRIISKNYGFIQWLVKNDKIKDNSIKQRTDLVKEIQIVDYETGKSLGWKNQYSETEQLIMYLSIQDNPLEFLIPILK